MSAAAERRAEKSRKMRERLRNARHHILGAIAPAPSPGTVFDPLPMFFDPGWMESLRTVAISRIARAGVGDSGDIPEGYSRATIRAAAREQAFQAFLTRFLERDYKRAGITETETARAVLSTLRICERNFWAEPGDKRERDDRGWFPFNRAQDSRTPDPRRVAHCSRFSVEDTTALLGDGDDIPTGETVPVAGGKYRPMTHGKMIYTERETGSFSAPVILDGDIVTPTETTEEYSVKEWRWKMERRRGAVQSFPACKVDPGKPAPVARFNRQPLPTLSAGAWKDRVTARETVPLPPVTRDTALANLRRLGRGYPRGDARRVTIAHAIRRMR